MTATALASSSGAVRTLRTFPGKSIYAPRCMWTTHQAANRDADDSDAKRDQEVLAHIQISPTMCMISSMDLCAAAISVPSKMCVSSAILPL